MDKQLLFQGNVCKGSACVISESNPEKWEEVFSSRGEKDIAAVYIFAAKEKCRKNKSSRGSTGCGTLILLAVIVMIAIFLLLKLIYKIS